MKLKHTLAILALLSVSFASQAQQLQNDINFSVSRNKSNIRSVDLFAGNNIISITQKGKLRLTEGSQGYYPDDFKIASLGNMTVNYYDNFDGFDNQGKVKSVGDIVITYYDRFDGSDNQGRVKSIGNMKVAYYDKFDGFDNQGKIKSIGKIAVKFYDRFDGDDLNGKLKSVGNTLITYYDRFDGNDKNGRVKAVTGGTPSVSIDGLIDD